MLLTGIYAGIFHENVSSNNETSISSNHNFSTGLLRFHSNFNGICLLLIYSLVFYITGSESLLQVFLNVIHNCCFKIIYEIDLITLFLLFPVFFAKFLPIFASVVLDYGSLIFICELLSNFTSCCILTKHLLLNLTFIICY